MSSHWWALTYKTNEPLSPTIQWCGGQKKKEQDSYRINETKQICGS